jgi:hypothetical protein
LLIQDDIENIIKSGGFSILLLLDGYDEIAGKYGHRLYPQVKIIMNYILGPESQFYVILTSRPNAIGNLESLFDRKI